MKRSSLAYAKVRSPLMEAMTLRPNKRRGGKKTLTAVLVLTSLVDAFCMILLYLLVQNTGNGSTIELGGKMDKLPVAVKTEALHQGAVIRVERNRIFIDEKQVDSSQLAQRLQEVRAQRKGEDAGSLIIQADRGINFAALAPVVRAGSISGFHKFKFAVLQAEGSL